MHHAPCRSDGPLLAAVKAGHWVLLDELNLASQPVLEGLNALLDHRAEVWRNNTLTGPAPVASAALLDKQSRLCLTMLDASTL